MHTDLEVAHTRLRHLLEQAPAAIAIYRGSEYRLEFANPAYYSVTKRDPSVLGRTHAEIFPEAQSAVREVLLDAYRNAVPKTFPELRTFIDRGSGPEETFFHTSLVPLRDQNASLDAIMSISIDVTERVRARKAIETTRAALEAAEHRLRLALSAAEMGVWEFHPDTERLIWDERCRAIYGMRSEEEVSRATVFSALHPEDVDQINQSLADILEAKSSSELSMEYRIHRLSDGELRWVNARGRLHIASSGTQRLIGTLTDGTELKAIQAARDDLLERERVARSEAEFANRTKDYFLAMVGHELRTPLNAILGWASMLTSGPADAARTARGIEVIQRNARAQSRIIEDILDVSRIVAGKLKLEAHELDLAEVVQSAIELAQPSATAKGLKIELSVRGEETRVLGDADRLQQVVSNLLSNAIKFTSRGSIRVAVENDGSQVVLTVRDSGVGMSSDFLPRVFDRFRQADTSPARKSGGLGLGLTIVRNLVELHGGRVSADSAGPGSGAVFRVELPALAAKQAESNRSPSSVPPAELVTALTVLVVEDDTDSREFAVTLLELYGNRVHSAASVDAALAAIDQHRFDLLISDVGMPGRDGFDLIRTLRARGDEVGSIPAVALTAYARDTDRAACLQAGFDAHVAKPIEVARLAAAIRSVMSAKSG